MHTSQSGLSLIIGSINNMSASLSYEVGDCITYKEINVSSIGSDKFFSGIITALTKSKLTIFTFSIEGVDEDHFNMQILKCDREKTYKHTEVLFVKNILVLPARYYTSGYGTDLYQSQLNKLPCFEGIEDAYSIVDVTDDMMKYFEIPSFYGSKDIYSKRAVNPEQLMELISSQKQYQSRAFSLYRNRCYFILQLYQSLRKYKRVSSRNNACSVSFVCLPTEFLVWLVGTLSQLRANYKYSVKKIKTSMFTYGVVQHDFETVVADTVFVSTEFSLSLDVKLLIPVFGVGCYRQVCPGHGGKRATETAINYVDGDMKFVINVLEGSIKIFFNVIKELFGTVDTIMPSAAVVAASALRDNVEVGFMFKSKKDSSKLVKIVNIREVNSFVKKRKELCREFDYAFLERTTEVKTKIDRLFFSKYSLIHPFEFFNSVDRLLNVGKNIDNLSRHFINLIEKRKGPGVGGYLAQELIAYRNQGWMSSLQFANVVRMLVKLFSLRIRDDLAVKNMHLKVGEAVEASMEDICPQLFIRQKRKVPAGFLHS